MSKYKCLWGPETLSPRKLGSQGVASSQMWVLGTKLKSSGSTASILNS